MAKGHENIIPPKKGERRNPKGRPKKLVSFVIAMLKDEGEQEATPEQIKQVYTLLITLTQERLTGIAKDAEMPMLYRIVAKEVLGGKGFEIIEKMLDRAHGKATTNANVDVNATIAMPKFTWGDNNDE